MIVIIILLFFFSYHSPFFSILCFYTIYGALRKRKMSFAFDCFIRAKYVRKLFSSLFSFASIFYYKRIFPFDFSIFFFFLSHIDRLAVHIQKTFYSIQLELLFFCIFPLCAYVYYAY